MKMIKQYQDKQCGFSIMELVIIITIISIALIGIASLLLQNLRVDIVNKNQLVASMLAQEGVELVRSIRDDNWSIVGNNWNTDLTDVENPATFTITQMGRSSINQAVNSIDDADTKLYLSTASYALGAGYYIHIPTVISTPFSRLITIDDKGDYMLITSDVKWGSNLGERHYIINATIYNWRGD